MRFKIVAPVQLGTDAAPRVRSFLHRLPHFPRPRHVRFVLWANMARGSPTVLPNALNVPPEHMLTKQDVPDVRHVWPVNFQTKLDKPVRPRVLDVAVVISARKVRPDVCTM